MKRVRVTAAILRIDDYVLRAQRSAAQFRALLWEFPGGKVKAGESDQERLVRELKEELGIETAVGEYIGVFPHRYQDLHIELAVYVDVVTRGEPRALEHLALIWAAPEELLSYDLAAADIPVAKALVKELSWG